MYASTIFQFKKMLLNLDQWMTKAEAFADAKKFEVDDMVNYRLAPDMYPFSKQIQSCCDSAKFAAAYLSGQTAPKHEDNETTWAELHARISKVVKYLDGFKESDFAKADVTQVKPGWAKGKWLHGAEYVQNIAVPNFYFHIVTAYGILRNAGVDVGKMDFMGQVQMRD